MADLALEAVYNDLRAGKNPDCSNLTFHEFRTKYMEIGNPKSATHALVTLFFQPDEYVQAYEEKFVVTNEDLDLLEHENPLVTITRTFHASILDDKVHWNKLLEDVEREQWLVDAYTNTEFPWPEILEELRGKKRKRVEAV